MFDFVMLRLSAGPFGAPANRSATHTQSHWLRRLTPSPLRQRPPLEELARRACCVSKGPTIRTFTHRSAVLHTYARCLRVVVRIWQCDSLAVLRTVWKYAVQSRVEDRMIEA